MRTAKSVATLVLCLGLTSVLNAQAPEADQLEARIMLNQGVTLFRTGDTQAAVDSFVRSQQLDPRLDVAYLYAATAQASMVVPGDVSTKNLETAKTAIVGFERYLQKVPGSVAGLNGVAAMYQAIREHTKARTAYQQLIQASPDNEAAFYSLAAVDWLLATDKDHPLPEAEQNRLVAEGLDNVDRALELDPEYANAMAYKNLLLRQKAGATSDPAEAARLSDEAERWFRRAIDTKSENLVASLQEKSASPAAFPGGPVFAAPPAPPPPPPPQGLADTPNRIGGDVAKGNLIHQVLPEYPAEARALRLTGTVLLQAMIDRNGSVADLRVISGHPLLNDAAIEAVRQWRYSPILLNGQPIDVVTTITLNFSFR